MERQVNMRRTFDFLFPMLSVRYPSVFPAEQFTWNMYAWAHSAVSSRLFPRELATPGFRLCTSDGGSLDTSSRGCMCPLLDMVNHGFGHHLEFFHNAEAARLEVRAMARLERGDEVLFSYGDHSNGRLYVTYGFCVPDNPFSVAPVDLGRACALAEFGLAESDRDSVARALQPHGLSLVSPTIGDFALRCARFCTLFAVDRLGEWQMESELGDAALEARALKGLVAVLQEQYQEEMEVLQSCAKEHAPSRPHARLYRESVAQSLDDALQRARGLLSSNNNNNS